MIIKCFTQLKYTIIMISSLFAHIETNSIAQHFQVNALNHYTNLYLRVDIYRRGMDNFLYVDVCSILFDFRHNISFCDVAPCITPRITPGATNQ